MTIQHDHAPTDWAVSVFGLAVSAWQWATDGMSPLSIAVALGSLVLVGLRIRESIERSRLMQVFGQTNKGVIKRLVDALQTKPGDLKD